MYSTDKFVENTERIGEIFPSCITESKNANGETVKSIDFDLLRQELSNEIVEGPQERYQISWPGKRESLLVANSSISKTMRPNEAESVQFNETKNIFIEGDNLDALKLLQESYLNKVKLIYIDPPYNTGNDFIYQDDFSTDIDEYLLKTNQKDESQNRLVANTQSNGRFHSDWLSMIYPRLKLARNLLREDGVIFISIDDSEQSNLKRICDEIFGEQNFIATVIWERAYSPVNLKKHFSSNHDYIICYAKNISELICNGLKRSDEANARYQNPDNDSRGLWKSGDLSVGPIIEDKVYEIKTPSGRVVLPPKGYCWRLSKDRFNEFVNDGRIWFGADGSSVPSIKRFLTEVKDSVTPMTIWKYTDVGHSQDAAQKLKKLFDGAAYFDYPKSVDLIKRCIELYTSDQDIILDFFAGSATTAQAVLELNAENNTQRKFIMVQLDEPCDVKSEAYKAGFKNISAISKERIRRAGLKIKKENELLSEGLDCGFRALKIDTSNLTDVYYNPDAVAQDLLSDQADNVKADRSPEDLLFQVLLDWGVDLSLPIKKETIQGKTVYLVDQNALAACFDGNGGITEDFVKELAKKQPLRVVFRDAGFKSDSVKINVEQIFKLVSPGTEVKCI